MRILLSAIALVPLLCVAGCGSENSKPSQNTGEQLREVLYACPMHPDVTSSEPASCTKCGMSLVETAERAYQCPMHTQETSDHPGKCSKCGMDLAKNE